MSEDVQSRDGHVLVADDPGVCYVVRLALESEGLEVKAASNGSEAMDLITQQVPALLVLDLTMPVRGGSEVARELRSRGRNVPILLITGDGHAAEEAQAVGAYAYLRKPFEVPDLVTAVRSGLEPSLRPTPTR